MKKILTSMVIGALAAFAVGVAQAATWTNTTPIAGVVSTNDVPYAGYLQRGVYMLEASVDLSTYGTNLTANDVIQCIPVRAGSKVIAASMDVVSGSYTNAGLGTNAAWTSYAITASLGDGSGAASYIGASSLETAGTTWVTTPAATVTVTGTLATNTIVYLGAETNLLTNTVVYVSAVPTAAATMTGYSLGKQYTASDTIDITLAGSGDWTYGLRGKVLVRVWLIDLIH